MSDYPAPGPGGPPPSTDAEGPVVSRRQRRQIERASGALGEPVTAVAAFRVEGTLPWYLLGIGLGAGLLGGAVGTLIGFAAGYAVARIVTRRRAAGFGFTTILAVTATHLCALKGSIWSGRPVPDGQIGSWPLADLALHMPVQVRRKRLTVAVALDLGHARRVRLESVSRKRAERLIARLPAAGVISGA